MQYLHGMKIVKILSCSFVTSDFICGKETVMISSLVPLVKAHVLLNLYFSKNFVKDKDISQKIIQTLL
ncbi:hypothetical protein KUTeg_011634 [Tegillarca granosa]|uniref:Uncharacterized protein n=1 Tax=Tegillarca granosa TaxID=220873 RepID=A0ABQ9EX73_TEGGR|nr:hypothetical protein KUTeg_011634 [Tegillarca granosa]